MVEEDLRLIRAWMNDDAGAPAWSEDDLAAVVKAPSPDQRRVRRGWAADQTGSGATGFAVATALSIPGAPAECELEFVLVRPQVRRTGIGGMLVHAALNWGRDLLADEIRLEVRESNVGAVQLYERCGFVIVGRRPGYYADPSEDALLMRRQLGC
ncbi:MAG: GNAT family N-acetyltransferase [Acidobacteriaceae bacterium]